MHRLCNRRHALSSGRQTQANADHSRPHRTHRTPAPAMRCPLETLRPRLRSQQPRRDPCQGGHRDHHDPNHASIPVYLTGLEQALPNAPGRLSIDPALTREGVLHTPSTPGAPWLPPPRSHAIRPSTSRLPLLSSHPDPRPLQPPYPSGVPPASAIHAPARATSPIHRWE